MINNAVELDLEAQKLYKQFQGLEDTRQFYINEQQQLNEWRESMVAFAYLLSRTLNNYRLSNTFVKNKKDFRPLMKQLSRMLDIPQRTKEHKLTIRHRGLGLVHYQEDTGEKESQFDYVISCGDCVVDKPYIAYLVKNKIVDNPTLIGKLYKAFQFFAFAGISTIEINLNDWNEGSAQNINSCLMLWAQYINELAKDSKRVVYNESNQPDPNLTILANLNRFKREDLEKLVRRIHSRFMN